MATAGAHDVVCNLVKDGVLNLEHEDDLDRHYNGIVVSGDMLMVTDSDESNVQLHRLHDEKLLAISDRLQSTPRGICLLNDMEICVTLEYSAIEIMSVQCTCDTGVITRSKQFQLNKAFDFCHGSAKFMDNIVVSGKKEKTICWCIVSLIDGHVDTIHQICEGRWSRLSAKDNMVYIACASGYDSADTGVYGYDIQNPSKQPFTYKHECLNRPQGITVDSKGFIFVCNWDPLCIHHLTDKCKLVAIYREGIPLDALDIFWYQGLLYVTSYGSKVITRYKPVYQQGHIPTEVLTVNEGKQSAIEETPIQREHRIEKEMVKDESICTPEEVLPISLVGSTESLEADGEGLPPEILNMDEHFQKLYREVLASGVEEVYNIRVMIVGHQGVGKTSLTQRLLGEEVKEFETQPTEGIEVHAKCCQIDHATREWKKKWQTDELFLNDQRIASILHKYVSPQNNQDIKATDPVSGIFPGKTPRLSPPDPVAVPSPLDGDKEIIPNEVTVSQISQEAGHITQSEDEIPSSHLDNSRQTGSGLDEANARTYPEEIKNFIERAQSLLIPKRRSSDVTLLDFAGQSLFYTTHQAFMSWRTLYLLVTDMSLPLTNAVEEDAYSIDIGGKRVCNIQEYVTYWLNSIHSNILMPEDDRIQQEEINTRRGDGSRSVQETTKNHPFVILVGTHSDKIPKDLLDQRKKSYFDEIRKVLKKSPLRFYLVDEDFAISNLGSDPTINALKSKIFETAQKQMYWGEKIPARWIPLERALLMELKTRGIQVIDYEDVKSLNETLQVRIERPEELDLFLVFEHDMGNIVFFNTERLKKKVVLDPKWLIHGVRTWITSDQVINRHPELSEQWFEFKNTGRLTSTLIEKLWSSHSKIHQHKEHLLDVMEKLNIIAKPLQTEEEEYYWVPCMVSNPAPDDVKKLQHNEDTTRTSTLCFRPKANFIHVGVFHRLLATCLSKWAPAKEGNTYLLFPGLCVFDLDEQQQLLLSLNDIVIQATVIRFTTKGRIPDLRLCMTIRDNLYTALSEISDCLCPRSEFEICIKCKESSPLTNEGLHSINSLRTKDELKCSTHKKAHCVDSIKLLGFWEENKTQIPDIVLPQHSAHATERFTRLSSLVLDVGSKVLRKVLLYYTTTSFCTLDEYMKKYEPDILELQKRKVVTQAQMDIIFPQSGHTDIDEYDITLASALLNNIYPLLGEQEKQIIIDLCTKQGELVHCHSTKMSEQDFQTKWTLIKTTLTDLSKLCKDPNFDNKVQKEIHDIQQSGLFTVLSNLRAILKEMATVETGTGIYDSVLRKLSEDLISHNWKFFFRELSVAENKLVQVEINYHGNVQEQIYQLLRHLNQRGSLNKTDIIQALRSIERIDLVNKYSEEDFSAC